MHTRTSVLPDVDPRDPGAISPRRPLEHRGRAVARWEPLVGLPAIVAVAALLRGFALARPSLWFDEAYTAWLTRRSWSGIVGWLGAEDAHPPLYFLFMKAWTGLAGTSELALRLPSAVFATLTVVFVYLLLRRLGWGRVAPAAALLVALSPIQIMTGQDAKMYALLGMLTAAGTLALLPAVAGRGTSGMARWAAYAGISAALVYTHYFGALLLLAHGLWVLRYERRAFGQWLAAMLGVAVVFAPWAPSFVRQALGGRGWPWYRSASSYTAVADLFGLFAFGGSLFGMGGYFFRGTAPAAVQAAVLLPFLALAAAGFWSLASRPGGMRAAALLALPVGVVVAAILGLSLVRHPFYPRWGGFVSPFFAALLAQGAAALGARFFRGRRRPDLAAAALTLAVAVCGLPILARHYFDPTFRPYHWREAAAAVAKGVRPGDYFLYVNAATEVSFPYYFHGAYPSLTLRPMEAQPRREAAQASRPQFGPAEAGRLAARYPRIWVIWTPPITPEIERRLLTTLGTAFRPVAGGNFGLVWVLLLDARR